MFELGVRLASSDHDPLSIIDESRSDRDPSAAGEPRSVRSSSTTSCVSCSSRSPTTERASAPTSRTRSRAGGHSNAVHGPRASQGAIPSGGTFGVAQASFLWHHDPMLTRPHVELREGAERILGKDQERRPERLVLFADNEPFDSELRASVREKWIAAWLYLRHLADADDGAGHDVRTEFVVISRFVEQALSASSDPRHVAAAQGDPRAAEGRTGAAARSRRWGRPWLRTATTRSRAEGERQERARR